MPCGAAAKMPTSYWHSVSLLDAALTARCNRASRRAAVRRLFVAVSRLGDGLFWYTLMAVLPLVQGSTGLGTAVRMAAAGLPGVLIYRWLKTRIARPRPYRVHTAVELRAEPLDAFSFPSGHTLHAVCFASIAASRHPELAAPLWSFAALVAASRPILGLHYPSDVLAGGFIGAVLAQLALRI